MLYSSVYFPDKTSILWVIYLYTSKMYLSFFFFHTNYDEFNLTYHKDWLFLPSIHEHMSPNIFLLLTYKRNEKKYIMSAKKNKYLFSKEEKNIRAFYLLFYIALWCGFFSIHCRCRRLDSSLAVNFNTCTWKELDSS